jgi:NADH-quinone oxidoreductase subunit H
MILASFLIVMLFLGGWHLPFLTGEVPPAGAMVDPEVAANSSVAISWGTAILRIIVLHTKIVLVILFFMLVRWSWPRFRFDQLMALAWKIMLPLGMVNFTAIAIFEELRAYYDPAHTNLTWTLLLAAAAWGVCFAAWAIISVASPLVTDNRRRLDLTVAGVDSQI